MPDLSARIFGCFDGLATGDAIGKQTETLAPHAVRQWYPHGITGFDGPPGAVIPRYRGRRYEWRIGETTDDTEQTVAVARALLRTGVARHDRFGAELLRCRKSLHPGVRLWDFHQRGDAASIAHDGDGCGAAMRVAAVGILCRSSPTELVDAAYQSALPTHGGPLAIGAAAAVAAAIAAALDGATAGDVLAAAVAASRQAERLVSRSSLLMSDAIARVHDDLASIGAPEGMTMRSLEPLIGRVVDHHFPACATTIVPVAIALSLVTASAEASALVAANVGGDADSVASIAGAIAGARDPASVNRSWTAIVASVDDSGYADVARELADRVTRPAIRS